jgi:hypothetical protein
LRKDFGGQLVSELRQGNGMPIFDRCITAEISHGLNEKQYAIDRPFAGEQQGGAKLVPKFGAEMHRKELQTFRGY